MWEMLFRGTKKRFRVRCKECRENRWNNVGRFFVGTDADKRYYRIYMCIVCGKAISLEEGTFRIKVTWLLSKSKGDYTDEGRLFGYTSLPTYPKFHEWFPDR